MLRSLCVLTISALSSGGVIINEFSASSNDRVFTRDANGNAQLGSGTQWWEVDYNDSFWRSGTTPIGFGYGDIATNVEQQVRNQTPTLYTRQTFTLTSGEAASTQTLQLTVDYDDSFIAFLNGKEIARADAGATGTPHYPSQVSLNSNTANGTGTTFSIGSAQNSLQAGENVLAIEVHNDLITSNNLKLKTTLRTSSKTYLSTGDSCTWFPGWIMPSGGVFDPAFADASSTLIFPWATLAFDDSAWATGPGPVGAEISASNPYALGTDLDTLVFNQVSSVYMRHEFDLTQAQFDTINQLELSYDYDDGCAVFLNGSELLRGNLGTPGQPIAFDARSDGSHGASTDNGGTYDPDTFIFDRSKLRVGTNVLAGQVHNNSLNSSDLILSLVLRTTGAGAQTLVAENATYSYFVGTAEPSPLPAFTATPELAFSDWIELYNPDSSVADLSGWQLSDDATIPSKFTFPSGTTIPAGGYLLVLADDQADFNDIGQYLHAPFKLSTDGEDLILSDASGTTVSAITAYPKQYDHQSYGFDSTGMNWGYYDHPTPGSANSTMTLAARVDAPDFSPLGGFYDSSQNLTLTSTTVGAEIRYTTDGSEPTATTGNLYTTSLSLNTIDAKTVHVIRARAFKAGMLDSKSKVHNYLIGQATALRNTPALLFSGDENETFYDDHGVMTIEGGSYVNSQWQENGPNSYNLALQRGPEFERPLFVEFYRPDGSLKFREDAGLRLSSSGYSRPRLILSNTGASPWTNSPEQKPSFNLYFRDDYGADKLESNWLGDDYPVNDFQQLRVRAGKNDIQNPFIVDEAVRRLFGEMGQESSHGVINTLYINGEYKGFFNLCERLREPFMQKHHGSSEDWDVRQVNDYANGDVTTWNEMMAILNRNGNNDLSLADWQEALDFLDPVNMADYFLINIYGATWDWPQNNWVGARERSPEGKYRLYVWDAEGSYQTQNYFNSVSHNTLTQDLLSKTDPLCQLFQGLMKSPEWRLIFADRVQKHLFNDGVLDDRSGTTSRISQNFLELEADYEPLLKYQFGNNQNVNLNFLNTWTSSTSGRRRYLFGNEGQSPNGNDRTDLADNGLWPSLAPPSFSQHGGDITASTPISISTATGSIYYTTDGSDPRELGGGIQSGLSSYSSPLNFNPGRTTLKARTRNGSTWSALTEAEFIVDLADPTSSNLVISEFLYHPPAPTAAELAAGFNDQDDFEFIELMNTSSTDTIDLSNLSFTSGIGFFFTGQSITSLEPGERAIIVSNLAAFNARYPGNTHPIAGEYSQTLSNSTETLTLTLNGAAPVNIQSFTYSDDAPWPACSDGPGFSLVLINPSSNPDHSDPLNWECSNNFGGDLNGSPLTFDYDLWAAHQFDATALNDPLVSGPHADPDQDGQSNLLEYASGTNPLSPNITTISGISASSVSGFDYPVISFIRSGFDLPLSYRLAASPDLSNGSWSLLNAPDFSASPPELLPDGRIRETWRVLTPMSDLPRRFFRVEMTTE